MSFINFYRMYLLGNQKPDKPLEEYGAEPWHHLLAEGYILFKAINRKNVAS